MMSFLQVPASRRCILLGNMDTYFVCLLPFLYLISFNVFGYGSSYLFCL